MNEYFATQSSDRSVHVYSVSVKHGVFEASAIGKNVRMTVRHTRTPSASRGRDSSRPRAHRHSSITSDAESTISDLHKDDPPLSSGSHGPLTPASTPSIMHPPAPVERPSSRRSSFSGSNAPASPQHLGHFGRSPSPMPPLPAIRTSSTAAWASIKLYGDESHTNFYRRLTFSPDGAMLLTPAGQFEDPSFNPRAGAASSSKSQSAEAAAACSVYIYTRANFARSPVAQVPGFKKPTVCVKFSPILYELRPSVAGSEAPASKKVEVQIEKGMDVDVPVDLTGPGEPSSAVTPARANISLPSPALSASDSVPATPATPSSVSASTSSMFGLPYRMLYAVATTDSVTVHDTQQAGPICMLSKLHYDEFTDVAWYTLLFQACMPQKLNLFNRSPDGQCMMISSRDGYCTIAVFDEKLPHHHTQQHHLQLASIAHAHPLIAPTPPSHGNTGGHSSRTGSPTTPLIPIGSQPPFGPVASSSSSSVASSGANGSSRGTKRPVTPGLSGEESNGDLPNQPPTKRRRAALTHHGQID